MSTSDISSLLQVQQLFSGNTAIITSERQSQWLLFSIYKWKFSLSFTNYSAQRNVWGVWCAPKVWETGACSHGHTFTWMKRRWPVRATVLWEPVVHSVGRVLAETPHGIQKVGGRVSGQKDGGHQHHTLRWIEAVLFTVPLASVVFLWLL